MSEYMDRDAAIAVIEEKQKELCPAGRYSRHYVYGTDRERFDTWQEIIDALKAIPMADVEEAVHGEWQGEGDGYADGELVFDVWYCSECGYCIDDGIDDPCVLPKYCPNCGAKMDGGTEDVSD